MGGKKKRSGHVTPTLGDDAALSPEATSDPKDPDYFPSHITKAAGPSRPPPPPRTRAPAQPKSGSNPKTRLQNSRLKEHRQRRSDTQCLRDVEVKGAKKKRSDVTPANPPSRPDTGDDAASSPEATSDPKDPDYFPLHATKAAGPSRLPPPPRTRAPHRQRKRQQNSQQSRDVEEDNSLQEVDNTAVEEIDRMAILANIVAGL